MQDHTKQPDGLWVTSACEMVGRFTYYGLQASFILYLIKFFAFTDHRSYLLFGVFTALAFSLPIVGGWFGDRILGHKKAMLYGLALNIIGNLLLALPMQSTFYIGVAVFIVGIGLFKPNNSIILGGVYKENDLRREPGFNIFYAAMNFGAILGPITYGVIISLSNWHMAFVAGAISELLGLILMLAWSKNFVDKTTHHVIDAKKIILSKLNHMGKYLAPILAIPAVLVLLFSPYLFSGVYVFITIVIILFAIYIARRFEKSTRHKIFLFLILAGFSIFYFACQIQISSSLLVFIDTFVPGSIYGWHIPTQFYVTLEPVFIILLTVPMGFLWRKLQSQKNETIIVERVLLGLLMGCISFVIFGVTAKFYTHAGVLSPMIGIVLGNLFLGAGELCIGPAMISAATYMVPKKWQGTFTGIWWFAISLSFYLSNLMIAALTNMHGKFHVAKIAYSWAFFDIAMLVFGAFIVCLLMQPILRKLAFQN